MGLDAISKPQKSAPKGFEMVPMKVYQNDFPVGF
jgi:hypothetical protein